MISPEMSEASLEKKEDIKKGYFEFYQFDNDFTQPERKNLEKVEREMIEYKGFVADVLENPNKNISIKNIPLPIPEKGESGPLKIPMEGVILYSSHNYRKRDNDPNETMVDDQDYDKEFIQCDTESPSNVWYKFRVVSADVQALNNKNDLLIKIILKPLHDNGHAPIELQQRIDLREAKK